MLQRQSNKITEVFSPSTEARDGLNRTALREIKLMQEIHHENVMELIDVFGQKSNISLVLPFMETDLEVLIKDQSIMIVPAHTKAFLLATLQVGFQQKFYFSIFEKFAEPRFRHRVPTLALCLAS